MLAFLLAHSVCTSDWDVTYRKVPLNAHGTEVKRHSRDIVELILRAHPAAAEAKSGDELPLHLALTHKASPDIAWSSSFVRNPQLQG